MVRFNQRPLFNAAFLLNLFLTNAYYLSLPPPSCLGCSLTGFRLLNLARQVTQADPDARVLIIEGELRSALGNSLPKNPTRQDIVSVCLFRDAASSAVVGSSLNLAGSEPSCYEIVTGASQIVDRTSHLVKYFETDDSSICLQLDKELPHHIGLAETEFVANLIIKGEKVLRKHNLPHQIPSLENFDVLCHTGGPRVLSQVAQSLGISKSNMHSSWEVMTMHGNLSGASNLAIVDHHNQMTKNQMSNTTSEWVLCLAMGPGVCLEGLIMRDLRHKNTAPVISPPSVTEEDSRTGE